jgi:chitin synthase
MGDALNLYSTVPNEDNFYETCVQFMGTDRRLTSSIIYSIPKVKILQDTKAHAYTVAPNSFAQFFSQRKRWMHNTYFNTCLNFVGPNVHFLLRFFDFVDVCRMTLVYFRLFNTMYFIYLLSAFHGPHYLINLVPYIVLLTFPFVVFHVYALFNSHLKNQFFNLFFWAIINKAFTIFSTIVLFTLMLFSIGNFNWKL